MGWKTEEFGFYSRPGQEICFIFVTSRSALGHTGSPVQWVPGAVSPEVKQQKREVDHSTPTNAGSSRSVKATTQQLMPTLRIVELYLHSLIRLHVIVLT
jgi:hypothetical protein